MMSPRKKTDSYNLYSCTHLSRAKVNLKIDKNYAGRKKVLKYSSKPNPLLTINSSVGQTTVFLPPTRSLLKSTNELEDIRYSFGYDKFKLSEPQNSAFTMLSSINDNEECQIFSSETSTSDDFDFNSTDGNNSRYMPNILKAKGTKTKAKTKVNVKTNNKSDLVQDKSSRKRKQTYNLSNIKDDGLVLHDLKEKISLQAKRRRSGKRIETEEKSKEEKQEVKTNHVNLSDTKEDIHERQQSEIKGRCKIEKQEMKENHVNLSDIKEVEHEKQFEFEGKFIAEKQQEEKITTTTTTTTNLINLSKIEDEKPKLASKIEEKCKRGGGGGGGRQVKKGMNKNEDEKKNSCARFCPFTPRPPLNNKVETILHEPATSRIKNSVQLTKEFSIDIGLDNDEENPVESELQSCSEGTSGKSSVQVENRISESLNLFTESQTGIEFQEPPTNSCQIGTDDHKEITIEDLLGFENFKEFQSETEYMPFPVNNEFLIPDYLDSLNTSDFVAYSDEVHKLISPPLCANDSNTILPEVKNVLDMNANDQKLFSMNFPDPDEDEKKFKLLSKNSCTRFTGSFNSQNHLKVKGSNSIEKTESPVQEVQIGVKDTLINGYNPIDFHYNKDSQKEESNLSNLNSAENTSRLHKPQVIVEFNKFFLSYAHVECYEKKDIKNNCHLANDEKDQVLVSPLNLVPCEVERGEKKEKNLVRYFDDKTGNSENNQEGKKTSNDEISLERFECLECNIVFGKKRTLAIHRSKAHLGFYSYTCERCLTLCNSKVQLQRHSKRCLFPSSKKGLICPICKKKYSHTSSLKQHLKNKHGGLHG